MPCFGPLTAYRPNSKANDKRLVFKKTDAETGVGIKIPCGKCAGCALDKSKEWAIRCMHEKTLHSDSAFLTLTYSDINLPSGNTLVLADLQQFMKRLRDHYRYTYDKTGIRFFACGEYGSHTARPHYHVLLLDTDLPDRKLVKSGSAYNLYESALLSRLWPLGLHSIGDVTFDSAFYVARYTSKKFQNGKKVTDGRLPEFITMSRNPGLGTGYFEKYKSELLAHDNCIVNELPVSLPRFYDNKLAELTDSQKSGLLSDYEHRKSKRRAKISFSQRRANSGTTRLRVREVVTLAKLKLKGENL